MKRNKVFLFFAPAYHAYRHAGGKAGALHYVKRARTKLQRAPSRERLQRALSGGFSNEVLQELDKSLNREKNLGDIRNKQKQKNIERGR